MCVLQAALSQRLAGPPWRAGGDATAMTSVPQLPTSHKAATATGAQRDSPNVLLNKTFCLYSPRM